MTIEIIIMISLVSSRLVAPAAVTSASRLYSCSYSYSRIHAFAFKITRNVPFLFLHTPSSPGNVPSCGWLLCIPVVKISSLSSSSLPVQYYRVIVIVVVGIYLYLFLYSFVRYCCEQYFTPRLLRRSWHINGGANYNLFLPQNFNFVTIFTIWFIIWYPASSYNTQNNTTIPNTY